MAKVIRAKYENGALKPLEKLNVEEGEEVIVRIEKISLCSRKACRGA